MSDAYQLGQEAFERGEDMELNPYDDMDAQHDDWDFGWFDAYSESK